MMWLPQLTDLIINYSMVMWLLVAFNAAKRVMIAPKKLSLPPDVYQGRVCCLPRPRGCARSRILPFPLVVAAVLLGAER